MISPTMHTRWHSICVCDGIVYVCVCASLGGVFWKLEIPKVGGYSETENTQSAKICLNLNLGGYSETENTQGAKIGLNFNFGGGILNFRIGVFCKIWTKFSTTPAGSCITDSLSHTTYVETNKNSQWRQYCKFCVFVKNHEWCKRKIWHTIWWKLFCMLDYIIQECIPVGCVPPAAAGVSASVRAGLSPPGCGPGDPLRPDSSTSPLGVGLETCKACWDTTLPPQRPAAKHAGIPPAMHSRIPTPPVNRITDTYKNITLPQLRSGR